MVNFLNTFNPDKLLFNFRQTAGLPQPSSASASGCSAITYKNPGPYGGWENSRIGGHTMGHYLTAAAQALARGYGECKGADGLTLNARLSCIITALAECQDALGSGFIFGATMADPARPELQFDKLERSEYNDTWVPWYTMHKILAGLVEVYKNAGAGTAASALGEQALQIAERLGEWCWRRIKTWTPQVRENVIRVEFGGMNDCLYELYRCARAAGYKDAEHFWNAAHAFDEEWLFSHPQAIVNRHANTTIPKFVGAANRCMLLLEGLGTEVDAGADKGAQTGVSQQAQEAQQVQQPRESQPSHQSQQPRESQPSQQSQQEAKIYLDYCRNFWEEVVNHHTYITGGNSECEHFGLPDILDAERSNTNCETCNTYNMLKLSRMLFMMTGERKYADYYENTFLNAIMASVNAENAMTTYFQPMATGCFKTYCNPDVDKNFFWCCTGTGLENFTKLGDSFYFYDEDTLYVNMYVSSSVHWAQKKIILTQKTEISNGKGTSADFEIGEAIGDEAHADETFTLAFRLPDWLASAPEDVKCLVNGASASAGGTQLKDGYLFITRNWQSGDKIHLELPMTIRAYGLPDSVGKTFAFKYGPLVLAAELGGDDNMKHGVVGVQCDVSANKIVGGLEMPLSGNYGGTSNLQILPGEIIRLKGTSLADFIAAPYSSQPAKSGARFERLGGDGAEPRFRLLGTDFSENVHSDFVFSAYNRLNGQQRYGIYWLFVDSDEAKQVELQNAYKPDNSEVFIEGIGVGYGAQTEGNENTYPHLQEKDSVADPHELFRYAKAGGYFSYEFAVKPGQQNFLVCTFLKSDNGKTMQITAMPVGEGSNVPETKIASLTLDYQGSAEKYTQRFAIPTQLTPASSQDKAHLRIKFAPDTPAAATSADSARLCAPVKTVYTRP